MRDSPKTLRCTRLSTAIGGSCSARSIELTPLPKPIFGGWLIRSSFRLIGRCASSKLLQLQTEVRNERLYSQQAHICLRAVFGLRVRVDCAGPVAKDPPP